MSVSQIRALTERVDALEQQQAALQARLDAWCEGFTRVFDAAGMAVPPVLRYEQPRPDLSVIQGGAR